MVLCTVVSLIFFFLASLHLIAVAMFFGYYKQPEKCQTGFMCRHLALIVCHLWP